MLHKMAPGSGLKGGAQTLGWAGKGAVKCGELAQVGVGGDSRKGGNSRSGHGGVEIVIKAVSPIRTCAARHAFIWLGLLKVGGGVAIGGGNGLPIVRRSGAELYKKVPEPGTVQSVDFCF